jgi:hypothetical protein
MDAQLSTAFFPSGSGTVLKCAFWVFRLRDAQFPGPRLASIAGARTRPAVDRLRFLSI